MFAGNFAIRGWAFCDGSLLPISENDALFSLIGTTYGGDGQETFALPDLRGRVPVGLGQGPGLTSRIIGENGGAENVTLGLNQLPSHSHAPRCSTAAGTSATPAGNFWAANANTGLPQFTSTTAGLVPMHAGSVGSVGATQAHENLMPYLGLNFIIALEGIFPSRN